MRELAMRHPRYGYRRIHALLCREGARCNRKRVQRLWRDEGLHVPKRRRRKRRGARIPGMQAATAPNEVWAMDYQFDQTASGRRIKILNVTDEFTREALACVAERRIDAEQTTAVLDSLVTMRGAPRYVRCDNGPEFVGNALTRWCQRSGARTAHIEPGAPWQNPYVESFNGHLRRELLELELFDSLLEAKILIEDWRTEYNNDRPHQSLDYLTPAEFATQWNAGNEARLS
jgi:putative transposase